MNMKTFYKKATKKKKLAVFDIDGTIFRSSIHTELFYGLVEYGIFPRIVLKEIEEYHEEWINRRGTFKEFEMTLLNAYTRRLKGKVQEDIQEVSTFVIRDKKDLVYTYTRDLIKKLQKEGYFLLAISGSPNEIVQEFCKAWKFDLAYGAIYGTEGSNYTGELIFPSYLKKKEILTQFCAENNFSLKGSIGIGDTVGDVAFLEMMETPIAFNPNKELHAEAKKRGWKIVVERKDMVYEM